MSTLNYQQWRFYQFATRKIVGDFRAGLGFLFDNYRNISEESEIEDETDYVKYMKGDFSDVNSFGIAIQALYDSRINTINPEQGHYVEIDYRINFNGGLENESWKSIYIDARKYISLSQYRHKVFATRAFYWSTFDGNPHYLDLPSIGWDRYGKTGRGFTRNRFRSNALLFFEGEYRTDITKNGFLGAVFFSNISSVSLLGSHEFTKWNPAVGTGLRIKWNKKNNNNLTLDFGVSKNDWSMRFSLTENF
jgi:outer membrane protein assembly factor BamA